jgi:hypothetical protein
VTAPHPAYMTREALEFASLYELATVGELSENLRVQREADERAARCRDLCLRLKVRQELFQALVQRAASEAVVRAAKQRLADWAMSLSYLSRMGLPMRSEPVSYEDAAAEIVDTCMRLEREGLLERPIGGSR